VKTQAAKENGNVSCLDDIFWPIPKGGLILVDFGDRKFLIRFEKYHSYTREAGRSIINRYCSVPSWNHHLFDGRRIKEVTTSCIYGTHRLDFKRDPEFGIFLPSSFDRDIFLETVYLLADGSRVTIPDLPDVVTNTAAIEKVFKNIIRPRYFAEVVSPFIEAKPTEFRIPCWKKNWLSEGIHFLRVNMSTLHKKYEKATQGLQQGSFVYVGCKEEVYLLGVTREDNSKLYMQGTYTTSTKPIFYFSNNYLDFISRYDAEKPKFKGGGSCNAAVYRTYDIPGFDGKPFIFPQMGRAQNCKNAIFTGEPEIITGDVKEALEHFETTDFVEYIDIVEKYADTVEFIHPAFPRRFKYFI